MSKMFSKGSVRRLEPIMRVTMEKLVERLRGLRDDGAVIELLPMFGAFTNDVISEYAYGFSLNWVQGPQFNKVFFEMVRSILSFPSSSSSSQVGWLMRFVHADRRISRPGGLRAAVQMVHAHVRPSTSLADLEDQSRIRSICKVQTSECLFLLHGSFIRPQTSNFVVRA